MRSVTAKADGNGPPEWHAMPRCRLAMASSNEVPKPSPELRLRPSHKWEGDSRCESIWRRVRRFEMWVMASQDGHATVSLPTQDVRNWEWFAKGIQLETKRVTG
jgi:hypothetical protein